MDLDSEERDLWGRWRADRDVGSRDALILRYSPWARRMARDIYARVHSLGDAWHDCTQNALVGLLEAIERYDPERGVPFSAFARHRIRGAVFDGLRSLRESLAQETPSRQAEAIRRERLASLQEDGPLDPLEAFVATTVGLGLGHLLEANAVPQHAQLDAYAGLERQELDARVAAAVERLPERERLIMELHYYHSMPFLSIAAQWGVSKGRISQLHRRALEGLRSVLREAFLLDL